MRRCFQRLTLVASALLIIETAVCRDVAGGPRSFASVAATKGAPSVDGPHIACSPGGFRGPEKHSKLAMGAPLDLTEAQKQIVVDAVADRLADPVSARLCIVGAVNSFDIGAIVVCGYVEILNALGPHSDVMPFEGALVKAAGGRYRFKIMGLGDVPDRGFIILHCQTEGIFAY